MIPGRSTLTCQGSTGVSTAGAGRLELNIPPSRLLTGMSQRVYTSHRNTLLKDAGFISFVVTFDAEGNFLSEQVIEHGPHPFGGDFTVFCEAIASAIG
jgi:hypothetical protein